jgi:hypothetical protein
MTDAEAIIGELSAEYAATRETVSACLDVQAGVREVLLASEHDATRGELVAGLQVESGLAAILQRDARAMPEEPHQVASSRAGGPVAKVVLDLPAAERLGLRTHPSVDSFSLAESRLASRNLAADLGNLVVLEYLRDVWRILTRARDRAWHGDLERSGDLMQALTSAHALTDALAVILKQARDIAARLPVGQDRSSAQEIAREVDSVAEHAMTFVRDLVLARDAVLSARVSPVSEELFDALLAQSHGCDPARARSLAEDLDRKLNAAIGQALSGHPEGGSREAKLSLNAPSGALTAALHRTPVKDRADALVWLRDALDDFQGADLRDADLTRVPLKGVLWSDTTQWPDGWKEKIKQRSVPVPGSEGVFIIRGDETGGYPENT